LFSVDPETRQQKTYLWLRNDGTIEFAGSEYNLVRYQALEEAYNELKQSHNKLVQAFNAHVHTANNTPPAAVPDLIPANQSNGDITPAKIDELKTI